MNREVFKQYLKCRVNVLHCFYNKIEKNGKSIKENNLEKKHIIPIGTLIEIVSLSDYMGVRLYVVSHKRDCDGTPLYYLSYDKTDAAQENNLFANVSWLGGFSDRCLKIINQKGVEK
jgi:hypothetical protein